MLELLIIAIIIFGVSYRKGVLSQNSGRVRKRKPEGGKERKRIPSHMEDSEKRIMSGGSTGSAGSGKSYRNYGEDSHRSKRRIALRLMEGDPVPEGYVCVRCHYCGAENLVRRNSRDYHSCYFCREALD